ncbi:MAG: cupin domain-containing protein [Thermomicrobiales bacterium]
MGEENGVAEAKAPVTWAKRTDVKAFSPAPGVYIQPIVGEAMMTCWIALDPGASVVEHSHRNEQSGVVVEGAFTLTVEGEAREVNVGEGYVITPHARHSGTAGPDGVLIVETFVPAREDYVRAWRAAMGE